MSSAELEELQQALARRKVIERKTYQGLANDLGVHKALVWQIIRGNFGHASIETRNDLREKMGLTPERATATVQVCKTCGGLHMLDDCKGQEVKHVRKSKSPKEYKRVQEMPNRVLEYKIKHREEFVLPEEEL